MRGAISAKPLLTAHRASNAPVAIVEFPDPDLRALAFRSPVALLVAHDLHDVRPLLRAVERHAEQGRWVVGFVGYDAAPAFEPRMAVPGRSPLPLAWFAVFHEAHALDAGAGSLAAAEWSPDTSAEAHAAATERLREGIAQGRYYQVNLTLRMHARVTTEGFARDLYARLRRLQPRAFAALLDLGGRQVVCASPELFFRRTGRELETRPMKGTAPRGRWPAEDAQLARELASSEKERAENVMIVDLLRNDLGRVAVAGSVRVPALCEVERHPTVLQMTSTITATARAGVTLDDVFAALFPCGSVTGAPKLAAMSAIRALETSPRGAYCGAIGVIRPGGDATFAVAIRTAVVDADAGHATYGVGGGITWDSRPAAEYREALGKARVLTAECPAFELLETMRLEAGVVVRFQRHLARLAEAAEQFGFADPVPAATAELARVAAREPSGMHRLRLVASPDGGVRLTSEPFRLASPDAPPRLVALASEPVSRMDPFLYHKTTHRAVYDRAAREHPGAFDVLLHNEAGELTEFTRGNLVLEIGGQRLTPARACGLLAGVFRGELLARGEVSEAVLVPDDLRRASAAWFVNSLREWVPVHLDR